MGNSVILRMVHPYGINSIRVVSDVSRPYIMLYGKGPAEPLYSFHDGTLTASVTMDRGAFAKLQGLEPATSAESAMNRYLEGMSLSLHWRRA